ncbi:MAG: TPM domain-containing protein [Parcubacteria group bacterium]|nr:TPM domain-containing protein [Parcubacteria group bacterium]
MKRFIIALLLLAPFSVLALEIPAPPENYVLDSAELFSETFEQELIAQLTALERDTSSEIAILTIPTLDGADIERYALDVFRGWGIGQQGVDNGLLLLIALEDRGMRIEVGYGLEGRVTDADSSSIIRNKLVPAFQTEEYERGVADAVNALDAEVRAEADEYGFAGSTSDSTMPPMGAIAIILFALAFFQVILFGSLGKKKRKSYQRFPFVLLVAFVALLLSSGVGMFTWLIDGIVALIIHFSLRRIDYDKKRKGRSGKGGAGSGGFGGGSLGGGTSSGGFGGGSSGGGGASGSW